MGLKYRDPDAGESELDRDLRVLCCWLWRRKKGPLAKESGQPLAAGRDKETDSPQEAPGVRPADTLILAQ